MLAAPIHPSDLLQISGRYGIAAELPCIPGFEGVGEVTELGPEVHGFSLGQRVLLIGVGTWRSELNVAATRLVPLPPEGDAEQLAMTAINPLTAWMMLKRLNVRPGDWVVQSAANSAVGMYLIQMAKQAGVKTLNIVRRDSLVPELTQLGADAVVVDGPDLAEKLRSAAGGGPILHAVDAVGGETMTRMLDGLSFGASLVSYGAMSGESAAVHPATLIFKDLRVSGFWLAKWFESAPQSEQQAAFAAVIPMVASGQIASAIDARYPLEQIGDAVKRAAEGGRSGKVLLVPSV